MTTFLQEISIGRPLLCAALEQKLSPEQQLNILAHFPVSARDTNREGYLPLPMAANYRKYAEVVIASLEVFPEAARKKAVKHNLPLHSALEYRKHILPLHLATEKRSSLEVVSALLDFYPETFRLRDGSNNLPLHISLIVEAPSTTVAATLSDRFPKQFGSLMDEIACLYSMP